MSKKEIVYKWECTDRDKGSNYYIKFTPINDNPYEVDIREILLCMAEQWEDLEWIR